MAATHTPAASASGSTTPGKAPTAAAAGGASGLGGAKPAPEMPVTKGFEQLNEAQIAAEFMGLPAEKGSGERKEDTPTKKAAKPKPKPKAEGGESESDEEDEGEESDADEEEEDAESESDEEDEGEESDADEEEEDAESESDEEDEGEESDADEEEEDAFKGKKGLRKRFQQLLKENPKLKRENADLKKQLDEKTGTPEQVMPATGTNLFADAVNEDQIDKRATEITVDARSKLRWLNRHPEGGTYGEGDDAVELSAEQVEKFIDHYEGITTNLETQKAARKDWLKGYQSVVKELGADTVTELTKPKTATRESALFKAVPELMRDPAFLQVLADAKAGREQREKVKQGIKFVEVKPPGKKGKDDKSAKPKEPERSNPREKEQKESKPETGKLSVKKLDQLRSGVQSGDRRSQAEIEAAFLG